MNLRYALLHAQRSNRYSSVLYKTIGKVSMPNHVLITGAFGQDGVILTEKMISLGFKVIGLTTRKTIPKFSSENFMPIQSDYSLESIRSIMASFKFKWIFHLASKSNVQESLLAREEYLNANCEIFENLLKACYNSLQRENVRIFNASSSEIFSGNPLTPQNENTIQVHKNPYGESKILCNQMIVTYREKGLYIANGYLYNHESYLRPTNFFTSKVILGLLNRKHGKIPIGNLKSSRDWGLAKEYVDVFPRMLESDHGEDFIIATGKSHSVFEFIEITLKILNLKGTIEDYFLVDQNLMRSDDTSHLVGDITKAKSKLNWNPTTDFERIINTLVNEHIKMKI